VRADPASPSGEEVKLIVVGARLAPVPLIAVTVFERAAQPVLRSLRLKRSANGTK
jgi:hypothetical protein